MASEYKNAKVPLSSRALSYDYLIIPLSAVDPVPVPKGDLGRYVVVFQYGSVVC
eukprot:CAMPEP_0196591448 /NCGR_PEP_ID=MMETSP1081-20130531/69675_1 /TAXON_ID=36882 /ORGANISM="Pyramimonas amylifera, Strain CCMP720" /LENGTH=53 /DNA_ID=CAMNT_0041914815 /DNA_START=38 /DNA_END=196 /DNA_ORIENTATION=+